MSNMAETNLNFRFDFIRSIESLELSISRKS